MPQLDCVVTYLEMFARPGPRPAPTPPGRLALMRAESCTVSFYRYLYETVGTPWLWFERRPLGDAALEAVINAPTTEIFIIYVGGIPGGFFELDTATARQTELCYFGLVPDFIGRRLGRFLLQAAIDQAWLRPLDRFWLHTCAFDHPRALNLYQQAGFEVYQRRAASFEDPRASGILPRALAHPLLPPLDPE